MRVYLAPPGGLSHAMTRVARALARYAPPDVEVVRSEATADLVVLHVIGFTDLEKKIAEVLAAHQRYVVIQYCLRTTERVNVREWFDVWSSAELVWSYYNLTSLARYDGSIQPEQAMSDLGIQTYESPLGVDAEIFQARWATPVGRVFTVLTSGYVAASESVQEACTAAARIGGRVFHLGPDLKLGPHVTSRLGLTDVELAGTYGQCRFVSGLRRGEGFELPAAEGLCCGARPILYDQEHYRRWYDGLAIFVPESDPETVTTYLEGVFSVYDEPVTPEEIATARRRFDWERICAGFWQCLVKNRLGVPV